MYTLLIILQIYNKYPTKNNLMGEKNTFITFIKLEVGHFLTCTVGTPWAAPSASPRAT